MDVVVKQARHIVQCIPIQMAHADDDLERMAQGMLGEDQVCHPVAEGAPDKLSTMFSQLPYLAKIHISSKKEPTTVTVSIHNTSVSEVIYRESESAYSFHN